ncbi:MAG: vitamin K epoxide reductase family protein [Candidatus Latescibacterota bacterium]
MPRAKRSAFIALGLFSALGVVFSAVSASDFIAHLDRQVHAITCSYVPGLAAADITGSSGCYAVLMSPYSSVLRTWTWGGIPIALPALSVFAYLLFRALDVWWRKEEGNRGETGFLVVATLLPVATSAVYYWISVSVIGTVCKLCVGIYVASAGTLLAALWAHLGGRGEPEEERADRGEERPRRGEEGRSRRGEEAPQGAGGARYGLYFLEGVAFVVLPLLLYLALKPSYSVALGDCGELRRPEDRYGVRIPLGGRRGGVAALEVVDPLCPACKNFSDRLQASGLGGRLNLEGILFPLDSGCNWMLNEPLHPGACEASEALLCAGDQAPRVLAWIFAHQKELREMAEADPERLVAALKRQFPSLGSCIGSATVKTRLNRSLRWAVSNSLPVLAPQLYVGKQKLCDEDTDLGLEYALTRALESASGTRTAEAR